MADPNPRRILVVDDIELNRVVTVAVLRGATYDVDSVADGAEALRALDTKAYDLVLMDLDMPGLDGYSVAATINAAAAINDNAARRTKPHVVALSASDSSEARARSRDVGMADHIGRPISPRDLIREVGRLIAMPRGGGDRPRIWNKQTFVALVDHIGVIRMRGFLDTFLDQCEIMLATLTDADIPWAEIERSAHDMISVGGVLGFEDLYRSCSDLQRMPEDTQTPCACRELDGALRAAIDMLHRDRDDAATAA